MHIKIIHICEDEKFINAAIQQFENCFPNANTFYVLSSCHKDSFIHIENHKFVQQCSKERLLELAAIIEKNTIVVVHSLAAIFYDFVLKLPKNNKIVWFCFGYEVYNDTNFFKTKFLLGKHTAERFPDYQLPFKKRIIEKLRPYYRLFKNNLTLSPKENKVKVIQRIDYLGSSFYEEFQNICKLINQKKIFFDFWYYPLEQILDINAVINIEKKSLLIGNSGFKTGNHLDVFYKIKSYSLVCNKIIVPLNYGIPDYINVICSEGDNFFGDSFHPLLKFMSLQDYNLILEDVGVAILNNKRQQAIGNTIALLWMGTKVFLSNKNPFYSYLKRIGIIVYCYETELSEKSCNQVLTLSQMEYNRKILFNFLNREKLEIDLKKQILKINE